MIEQARHILKSVFGYDRFISLQQDVIENVLSGKDTLAVMPTGGGKSLCYQIPALILEGLTIVVSPLISLMKDQVEQLAEQGVGAASLNSSLSAQEYLGNVGRIRRGEAKLLYVAPETLLKPNLQALLDSIPVACLAIDEAHCISEWGPDFRPEYRQLAEVRARLPQAVCIALTATATPRVREDIRTCLGFPTSSEFIAGFNRENLLIRVVPKDHPRRQVMDFLKRFPNESGIIYCRTRKGVDDLGALLQSEGFSACPYHAGLAETERHRNQERFVRDEVLVMVATIAFGMGINKSNVRFVLHYDLPQNIESYYQEIGRAGRDGMPAECLLLFSYADIHKAKALIANKEGTEKRAATLQLNAMVQFAEADLCRRVPLLGYFGEVFSDTPCAMCDHCLAGDRELTDVTIPAQKFLSCVKRTGECFGINHIIEVLRGSKSGKVLQRGHNRLSTYGIGREYSPKQWQQLARQLLHKGLMVQDPEFGGLSLTIKAWEVFKGREAVFGRLDVPREVAEAPLEAAAVKPSQHDPQLFELLRQKRKELADAAGVPPFVIFSDRTLAAMATHFPQTLESLLDLHGIGQAKLERYGEVFLAIIQDYCREHRIEPIPHRPVEAPPVRPREERSGRQVLIGEAFNAGRSVESLAEENQVKPGRILHHLFHYLQAGHALRAEGLLPLVALPDERRKRVLELFEEHGPEFLRPVFEALNGEVGYDDLHVLRLYYLSRIQGREPRATVVPGQLQQTRQMVCLATSRKYSGHCAAGKEWLEGRIGGWIRPVSEEGLGELSLKHITLEDGETPRLLDILSVPLGERRPHTYQAENRVIGEGPWTRRGAFPLDRVELLCDDVERLWINGHHSLNGRNDRMPADLVRETLSSSLLFIRADNLRMAVGESARGLKKVWARFDYKGLAYRLTVTDPVIEAQYLPRELGEYPVEATRAYLTVSIGEPFEGFCYKLVAGVILDKDKDRD